MPESPDFKSLSFDPQPALPRLLTIGSVFIEAKGEQPPFRVVPLAVPIAGAAGLVIEKAGLEFIQQGNRNPAELQQAIALRLACGAEDSFLRLHAVDLVQVGAVFPYLGNLPEALFNPAQLITTGRELTALLESLLAEGKARRTQKLTHRHATIHDYNAATGMAEPLHVILLSSYPARWTREQVEMLEQLLMLAPAVGFWFVIEHDASQPMSGGWAQREPEVRAEASAKLAALPTLEFEGISRRFHLLKSPASSILRPDWLLAPDGLPLALPAAKLDELLTAMRKQGEAATSEHSGIRIPIGTHNGQPFHFTLGHDSGVVHALVGGRSGSGKSVLLHHIIQGALQHYTPETLELFLIDLKGGGGVELHRYKELPMVRRFLSKVTVDEGLAELAELEVIRESRNQQFVAAGVQNITQFNERNPATLLPRLLVIIDEFQNLFGDDRQSMKVNPILTKLAREARNVGIHLVLATQSLSGVRIDRAALNQLGLRIALMMDAEDSGKFLSNDAAARLTRPGQAIYNARQGHKDGNVEIKINAPV